MKIFKIILFAALSSLIIQGEATGTTSRDQTTETLVDPTRPNWFGLKKKKSTANRLVLNSLVMSPQRRIAVINGELMREGDTKREITVQQILADRVLITLKSGKKRVLKLENANKRDHNQKKNRASLEKGKIR